MGTPVQGARILVAAGVTVRVVLALLVAAMAVLAALLMAGCVVQGQLVRLQPGVLPPAATMSVGGATNSD